MIAQISQIFNGKFYDDRVASCKNKDFANLRNLCIPLYQ